MVIIDRLIGRTGDVRSLIGNAEGQELFDISEDGWGRLEVLQGLQFRRVLLAGTEIKVNFVGCAFESSRFQHVRSEAHFWAASNNWRNCTFESMDLEEAISPMNTFQGCRFNRTTITNYRMYQTLFENCSFELCTFAGLRAQLVLNRAHLNPDLNKAGATVLFHQCAFNASVFEGCFFEGIGFEKCSFDNVEARACDFSGVVADQTWWSDQSSDPFTLFLMKFLDLIRNRCGQESSAYAAIQNYLLDYKTGRTQSKDFSECLYTGKIPDEELDQIETELPKLMAKYQF
jgi:uncharacterized protein YjbI with pentapeptide repeats